LRRENAVVVRHISAALGNTNMRKSILLIILLLFCGKQRIPPDFIECSKNIFSKPQTSPGAENKITLDFQCYYNAGDYGLRKYNMDLNCINHNGKRVIRSRITIYSDKSVCDNKGPFQPYWWIKDSIVSESKINDVINYLNENKIYCLKCIKGFTEINCIGCEYYYFYYCNIKDTNVFWYSDRENKLNQPEIVGLKSIFNRKDIFKYPKDYIVDNYNSILDSLKKSH